MFTGDATQPWEVLETNSMRVGVTSLTNNEYLPLAADKASKYPFAVPLPSEQAARVAREHPNLYLIVMVPNLIRPVFSVDKPQPQSHVVQL